MQEDHGAAVEAANAEFYRAFERLGLDAMERLWSRQAPLLCVHPGWSPLLDATAILESWRRIFAGIDYVEMEFETQLVEVRGGLGWVHGTERLRHAGGGREVRGEVTATNLFRLEPTGWRMAVHHASPVPGG